MASALSARWGVLVGAFVLLSVEPAHAHDGRLDLGASFQQGFLHPITGVDHLVAMVAIGLLSGVLGGRSLVTVPALFVAFLLIGRVLGLATGGVAIYMAPATVLAG